MSAEQYGARLLDEVKVEKLSQVSSLSEKQKSSLHRAFLVVATTSCSRSPGKC
jgi:hypothetical protein